MAADYVPQLAGEPRGLVIGGIGYPVNSDATISGEAS